MAAPDLIIRDVRILDGTGATPTDGDVIISDGRIAGLGSVTTTSGPNARELRGDGHLVAAPGFIDTHTHDDAALVTQPRLQFKIAQGCTTVVIGNCGFSGFPATGRRDIEQVEGGDWPDLDGLRQAVAERPPAANAMALIGHNTIRALILGQHARRAPTTSERTAMAEHVERAMEQGACGVSTGLIYTPGRWSETDELIAFAKPAAARGGIYATHMRDEGDRLLESVEEALQVGREASCRVHISHHKAGGQANWGKVRDSLALIDGANDAGADVTLDVYPYTASSGPMIEYFDLDKPVAPERAERTQLATCPAVPEYEGRTLVEIARTEGRTVQEVVRRILTAPEGDQTLSISFAMSEDDIVTNLRHPRMMIGSDGIPDLRGLPHPRLFGTFPRVLARYVREQDVLPLPEAVRRMTSLATDRFGLTDRGRLVEGAWADVVVFDPDTVADTATYEDPKREPRGIAWVIVNGTLTYDHGRHVGPAAGRLLRYRDAG